MSLSVTAISTKQKKLTFFFQVLFQLLVNCISVHLWGQSVLPIAWLREADRCQLLEVPSLRTEEIKPQ
jgi:hypothetical protein